MPDNAGLMEAINAGIAEASPTPSPEPAGSVSSADGESAGADTSAVQAGSTEAGGPPGAADNAAVPASGGAAADSGAPADGDAATPDPVEAQKTAATPEVPAPKPGEQAPDPLNDPLPNALKRETKDRINTLIGMVKDTNTRYESAKRDRDDLLGAITDTGAPPEAYGEALHYLKLLHSPHRGDHEQALALMQREVATLARALGKPVPGVNMLEGFPDLIEEVSTGRLAPDRAQEIAANRHAARMQMQASEAQRRQQADAGARQRLESEGRRALTELGHRLATADPVMYAAKREVLVKTLRPVFATLHPSQWVETFKRAYDNLTVSPPAPRPAVPAGNGAQTPLRAGNPAGGPKAVPRTLAEAIDQGIAAARS